MKLILLSFAAGVLFTLNAGNENAQAIVEQEQGFFIFTHCKPVQPYEYVGTVKVKVTMSGSPQELFDKAIKKAKKEFPTGEGIIFNSDLDKVDVIKFK